MRNYVLQFFTRVDWDFDFNPPNPPLHEQTVLMNGTEDELQANLEGFIANLKTDPRNINIVSSPNQVYWLLDKANLDQILASAIGDLYNAVVNGTQIPWLILGDQSPRDTGWTDADGVKRPAPPSDSGGKKVKTPPNQNLSLLQTIADVVSLLAKYRNAQLLISQGLTLMGLIKTKPLTKALIDRVNAFFSAVATFEKTIRI